MKYINLVEAAAGVVPRVHSVYSAFHQVYAPDFSFQGEKHDFWEAVCILGGTAVITSDSNVYNLEKNNVIFHQPMEFHKIASGSGLPLEVVIFSFSADGDMDYFENGLFKIHADEAPLFYEIPAAADKISSGGIYAELLISRIERALILLKTKERIHSAASSLPQAKEFKKIVGVMKNHLHEKLTVEEIADLCSLSAANTKKIFTKYAGIGVMKYFNGMKIDLAAKMLARGASIIEVSDSLAFDNQNYFSTVFKRETGLSPSAYRKKNQI